MDRDSPVDRLRNNATGIASIIVTGTWLAAMFMGYDWWLAALLFGYIVVVPLVGILSGEDEEESTPEQSRTTGTEKESHKREEESPESRTESPLETLRNRYAAGELSDEQFEHKLEQLLETETIEDVEARSARERVRERESE